MASANEKNNLQEVFLCFKMSGEHTPVQHHTAQATSRRQSLERGEEEWRAVCSELLGTAAQDKVQFLEFSISLQKFH